MMTLENAKRNLEKDYNDALAAFASYLLQFEEADREDVLEDLDDQIFSIANYEWNLGEEWLCVYSGLMCAV